MKMQVYSFQLAVESVDFSRQII